MLAILLDQHARKGGVVVDFFGRPASTHRSAAVLHLATGAPLCFGACIRTGPMKFRIRLAALIRHTSTGNHKQDVQSILERLTHELEARIRTDPEQYLWAHRRWRDVREAAPSGGQ